MRKLLAVAAVAMFAFALMLYAAQPETACPASKASACQMAQGQAGCCAMAAAGECKADSSKCAQCPDKGKCDKKDCPKDKECKKDCPKKDAPPKK